MVCQERGRGGAGRVSTGIWRGGGALFSFGVKIFTKVHTRLWFLLRHPIRAGETTIKIKFAVLRGGEIGGREENLSKRCFFFCLFCGKRHDDKISKVQILLSRNFVVIAQAPTQGRSKESQSVGFSKSLVKIG